MLANVYLHYAFDNWAQLWQRHHASGFMQVVRFADDIVVCFQHGTDAARFLEELRTRLARFSLTLHPEKTRLLEFGRFAATTRQLRGDGRPETFNFLGFTHICGKTRRGRFCVLRKSHKKKVQAKLKQIKQDLRRRINELVPEIGKWLAQVLHGHYNYYGVPRNYPALANFHYEVVKLWKKTLGRRSDKGYITWERMSRLVRKWLPNPKIRHSYPNQRVTV